MMEGSILNVAPAHKAPGLAVGGAAVVAGDAAGLVLASTLGGDGAVAVADAFPTFLAALLGEPQVTPPAAAAQPLVAGADEPPNADDPAQDGASPAGVIWSHLLPGAVFWPLPVPTDPMAPAPGSDPLPALAPLNLLQHNAEPAGAALAHLMPGPAVKEVSEQIAPPFAPALAKTSADPWAEAGPPTSTASTAFTTAIPVASAGVEQPPTQRPRLVAVPMDPAPDPGRGQPVPVALGPAQILQQLEPSDPRLAPSLQWSRSTLDPPGSLQPADPQVPSASAVQLSLAGSGGQAVLAAEVAPVAQIPAEGFAIQLARPILAAGPVRMTGTSAPAAPDAGHSGSIREKGVPAPGAITLPRLGQILISPAAAPPMDVGIPGDAQVPDPFPGADLFTGGPVLTGPAEVLFPVPNADRTLGASTEAPPLPPPLPPVVTTPTTSHALHPDPTAAPVVPALVVSESGPGPGDTAAAAGRPVPEDLSAARGDQLPELFPGPTAPAPTPAQPPVIRAPEAEPLPPALADQVVEQVARSLHVNLRRGTSEMRLRLDPPELGEVAMRLVFAGRGLTADLVVAHPAAKAALEGNLDLLRQRLGAQGMELAGFQVAVAGGDVGGSGSRRQETYSRAPQRRPVVREAAYALAPVVSSGHRLDIEL